MELLPRRCRSLVAGACLLALGVLPGCSLQSAAAQPAQVVGLITKTEDNPYFLALRKGATAEGAALGVHVESYSGKSDGDTDSQVAAIKDLIAKKASGIIITPAGSAVLDEIAEARKAGLFVVAVDSPTDPVNAVDATIATDNFAAGRLIGQWAARTVDPATARIAMLDLSTAQVPVDVARDQGFLSGFGIDLADAAKIGDETDPRIVAHAQTGGDEAGGKKAMEQVLVVAPDVNLVYTINESSAAGAYEALQAAGLAGKVVLVSIDGGCDGISRVADGRLGATAMQFPLRMARLALDAIIDHRLTGDSPAASPGLDFLDSGTALVTKTSVSGLQSSSTDWASKTCWG